MPAGSFVCRSGRCLASAAFEVRWGQGAPAAGARFAACPLFQEARLLRHKQNLKVLTVILVRRHLEVPMYGHSSIWRDEDS